jgi:homoserine O-succinyltransferase
MCIRDSSSTSQQHLEELYLYFEDVISKRYLDGLILTGAPVEDIDFEKVLYWNEISEIIKYARTNIYSVMGICWGGLALAKIIGIDKVVYPKKIFGVFQTQNLNKSHPVLGDHDDIFWCPHSRHAGIPDDVLETASKNGLINLLAHSKEAGYTIFESSDSKFLMHLGHPEYNAQRLVDEYTRDVNLGRKDVDPPANISIEKPQNRWRGHRNEFFGQWIKYIHDKTNTGSSTLLS